ncbi:hypothetical protein [uncultured Gimesia sp.]|jgi:hypothetical protein|uniref:hypothetical protein n=1 Tax=uncultured Gimesia sp. TaxID=1678688 RepID=UPI002632ECFA|nr:hypothetical protein [uncultured Gimesia sp.]
MNANFRFNALLLYLFVTLLPVGCSSGGDAPARFDLSGTVNYKGEPVPYGELIFIPDSSKGNKGAGSVAKIESGRYQTQKEKGVIGGPHRVQIKGFTGSPTAGAVPAEGESVPQPLFKQYETEVDFPLKSSTYDFEIPSTQK